MPAKSTAERYGTVALSLHWASAALILALVPLGFSMQTASGETKLMLYHTHAILGVLVGFLTLMRLVWWLAFDRKPQAQSGSALQRGIARAAHGGLYLALVVLAVSGLVLTVSSSLVSAFLAGDWSLIPASFADLPPRRVHGFMARALMALFALHVLGALYHHWIKRDGTLGRMLPKGL